MRFTEKRKARVRNIIISMIIICAMPLLESGRPLNGASSQDFFAGKEIVCAIDLCDDMYGSHGLETGLNYQLIGRFADDNKCNVKIVAAGRKENWLDSLRQGKADIVIMHEAETDSCADLNLSRNIDECTVWAVKEARQLRQVNRWISHITSHDYFREAKSGYCRTFNPYRRAERGIVTRTLSPYDDIIKQYASELGWDWRMLAAVIYQESKFSINSVSHRGAKGLMQVMPQTARHYGIEDLLNPENNVKAGTSHLQRLQRLYADSGMNEIEKVKFTLAAYNAGEGRIADCRRFAESRQADKNSWESVVSIIPLMREDSILEDESVKLGKFEGYETIAYIDSIMSLYDAFCRICPGV
jgi:membrane-bound lytic murein transglycosylase MltF